MPDRSTDTITDLRRAIDCLPQRTRQAMLEGIRSNPIIVGAYSDDGGICPMLAAHRNGGRTDFIAFARAWDQFAFRGVRPRRRRPRQATLRELRVLEANLEASLLEDDVNVDLRAAVRDHRRLVDAAEKRQPTPEPTRRSKPRPGDPDRSRELRRRPGWRWMRVARSMDEYESLIAALEHEHVAADERTALRRELELQLSDH